MDSKKPPLGITPRDIWVQKINGERFLALASCMKRYLDYSIEYVIPKHILEEYAELSRYVLDQNKSVSDFYNTKE